MFFSVIRKTLSNRVINELRQSPSFFHTSTLLLRRDIDDVLAVKAIEENLFENNQRQSSYVNKREILQQYNKKWSSNGKDRRQRKQETTNERKVTTNEENVATTPSKKQTKPVKKEPPELVIDEEIGFRYTKLQRNDQLFQQLMLTVKSKKHRGIKHQLLLEGRRLILDALKCGLPLKYLIFSDKEQLKLVAKFVPKDITCYKVPQGDLSFWSTLTTCPGLIAIFEKPVDMSHIWKQTDHLPIIVICDQVREPNNVGGIIRACASVPVEKVIMTKGCADHWDTKALRGGAGAQFLIPTMGPMSWDSIYSILPPNYNVLVAENNAENAENELGDRGMHRFVAYTDIPLSKSCVVIIGGETEGVSAEAYELLKMDSTGCCVHIPLANGVDSLNTSTALAIVLFEIKKQMTEEKLKRLKANENDITT